MFRLRSSLLCVAITMYILASGSRLGATPPLSTISDTLFNADGTLFNGIAVISWLSFEASDTSNIGAQTLKVPINRGVLYVQLVPTTDAHTAAIYTVQYTSLGATQYSEAWTVPPSLASLRVRDVKVPSGTVTGSGPAAATIINISDINGLQNALNVRPTVGTTFSVSRSAVIDAAGAIDGAAGNPSDCLHVDGTSAPCSSGGSTATATFMDAEVPSGTMDGSNGAFSLARLPNPPTSVALYRNGLLLRQGGDYIISLNAITFQPGAEPRPGDILLAHYRMAANIPGVGFVDQETPSGSIDGLNTAFTLTQTPSPVSSLVVYRNGLRMASGIDYTLSGAVITFAAGSKPQSTDTVSCSYRYAQ